MIDVYKTEQITMLVPRDAKDWMEPRPPTEEVIWARVDDTNELVRNDRGEMVRAAKKIYISHDLGVGFRHRFRVYTIEHSIIKIDRKGDFTPRYILVWLA